MRHRQGPVVLEGTTLDVGLLVDEIRVLVGVLLLLGRLASGVWVLRGQGCQHGDVDAHWHERRILAAGWLREERIVDCRGDVDKDVVNGEGVDFQRARVLSGGQ